MRKVKYVGIDTITALIPIYTYEGIDYRKAIVEGDTVYIEGDMLPRHLEIATKHNLNKLCPNIFHVGVLVRKRGL